MQFDPSVLYLFTKCFSRRKEDWRVFSTLTANFDYKLISHFSCFDLFSNFWHKTSHPLKVAQNFIFLHIPMATREIYKLTASDFKKMKTSFIIMCTYRFYGPDTQISFKYNWHITDNWHVIFKATFDGRSIKSYNILNVCS